MNSNSDLSSEFLPDNGLSSSSSSSSSTSSTNNKVVKSKWIFIKELLEIALTFFLPSILQNENNSLRLLWLAFVITALGLFIHNLSLLIDAYARDEANLMMYDNRVKFEPPDFHFCPRQPFAEHLMLLTQQNENNGILRTARNQLKNFQQEVSNFFRDIPDAKMRELMASEYLHFLFWSSTDPKRLLEQWTKSINSTFVAIRLNYAKSLEAATLTSSSMADVRLDPEQVLEIVPSWNYFYCFRFRPKLTYLTASAQQKSTESMSVSFFIYTGQYQPEQLKFDSRITLDTAQQRRDKSHLLNVRFDQPISFDRPAGFRLFVTLPNDYPTEDNFDQVIIDDQKDYAINLKMTAYIRENRRTRSCSNSAAYKINEFQDPFKLTALHKYAFSSCVVLAIQRWIITNYKCVFYAYPIPSEFAQSHRNGMLPSCFNISQYGSHTSYNSKKLYLSPLIKFFTNIDLKLRGLQIMQFFMFISRNQTFLRQFKDDCNHLMPCKLNKYSMTMNSAIWPRKDFTTSKYTPMKQEVLKWPNYKTLKSVWQQEKVLFFKDKVPYESIIYKNLCKVTILIPFGKMSDSKEEQRSQTLLLFVANLGGLLGLYFGISVITFYHFSTFVIDLATTAFRKTSKTLNLNSVEN